MFELKFPNPDWTSGLWPGGHLLLHLNVNGKSVCRKYTPTSPID